MLQKQPKPLPSEIVRFPAYVNCEDPFRGTTVLPYLEVYYNYNEDDYVNTASGTAVTQGANTLPSPQQQQQPLVNHTHPPAISVTQSDSDSRISQYKSRIPSQENGEH